MAVLHFNDETPHLGRYVHFTTPHPKYPGDTLFALRCNECGRVEEYTPPMPHKMSGGSDCPCCQDEAVAYGLLEDHHFESDALWDAFSA